MVVRHIATYMAAHAVSACLGFAAIIVYTRLLSPAEYGLYTIGMSTAGILAAVFFAWIRNAVLRFESEGGSVDVRRTGLVCFALSALALPLALGGIVLMLDLPAHQAVAAGCFAIAISFFELNQEILRARLRPMFYLIGGVLRASLALCFGTIAVFWTESGLALLFAVSLAYLCAVLALAFKTWEYPVARFNGQACREFAKFGAPFAISSLVFALSAALDRLLVVTLLGHEAAGHYGASADFVRQIILIPAISISAAAFPIAFRTFAQDGEEAAIKHLEKSAELFFATMIPAATGFAIVSDHIAAIVFGQEFRAEATELMPVIAFAAFLAAISQFYFHIGFHITKRTYLALIQETVMLIAGLALMVPLIRTFGLEGAAGARVATEAIGCLVCLIVVRRIFRLPLIPLRLMRIAPAVGFMAFVTLWMESLLPAGEPLTLVSTVLAGLASYAFAVYVLDICGARRIRPLSRLADAHQIVMRLAASGKSA